MLSIFVARWDYQMDIIKYIASFLFLLMIPPGLMFSTLVYWIYCYFGGYSFFEDEYAMTEKEAEEIEKQDTVKQDLIIVRKKMVGLLPVFSTKFSVIYK